MAKQDLLNGMNDQLNREVSTFLRYMLQAASIRGAKDEPVRQMYLAEVMDEMGHAQYLANQICLLGGTPSLAPDLTPPPIDVTAMLRADAEAEKNDVRNYMELVRQAEAEGLIGLKMKMEEQAADEDAHGQEMLRLIGRG